MLAKAEVYELIEDHYRSNFKHLVMRFRGPSGSRHNGEDIVQEAYTRAMKYWHSFNVDRDFKRWFSTILLRCLKDKIKDEKEHGFFEGEIITSDTQTKAFNRIIIKDVQKIIHMQPDNVRYILTLYFFEQYKTKEIAEIVPESHTNIRRIIHDFRKTLRRKFDVRLFE